jgi:hypothetical protein
MQTIALLKDPSPCPICHLYAATITDPDSGEVICNGGGVVMAAIGNISVSSTI